MVARIFVSLLFLLPVVTLAQEITAVDVSDLKEGESRIVTKKNGVVSSRPIKLIGSSTPTNPPTDPPADPALTPFEKVIFGYTRAAMTNEAASKTTGAALSEVYSRVSSAVASGTIKPDQALPAVFAATNLVMGEVPDKTAWNGWREDVGNGLEKLKQDGSLTTAAQYATALKEVSNGLNAATGYSPQLRATVAQAVSDLEAGMEIAAHGILDGIDIDKIIKIIELIMKLLALFGGLPG